MVLNLHHVELPGRPEFTLPGSRRKWVLMALVCLVLGGSGLLAVRAGESLGWLPGIFFGGGLLVALVQLLPGSSYLRVGPEGIEWCALFRRRRLRWDDIEGFGHFPRGGQEFVGILYPRPPESFSEKASLGLVGFHEALPDTYGRKAADLAAILVACRAHFLKAGS